MESDLYWRTFDDLAEASSEIKRLQAKLDAQQPLVDACLAMGAARKNHWHCQQHGDEWSESEATVAHQDAHDNLLQLCDTAADAAEEEG